MKRGTVMHPKTKTLATKLNLRLWGAVGILESLWHFTATYAKRGDIGRWPNQDIANALDWEGDADALIDALVEIRWLDKCNKHRLLVHDWAEHADQGVERSVEVKKLGFAKLDLGNGQEMLVVSSKKLESFSSPNGNETSDRHMYGICKATATATATAEGQLVFPSSLARFDLPEVHDAGRRWVAHLAAKGKPCIDPDQTIMAAIQCYGDPTTFCEQVNRAIAGNWANLQQPEPKRDSPDESGRKLTEARARLKKEFSK